MIEQPVNNPLTVTLLNAQGQQVVKPLRDNVKDALKNYLAQLNGEEPTELYELVLSEITKAENIEVSDDEVNAEIDKMATMYGMDKEALLADVRKSGNYARFIDETKYRLSHEKTIDLLVNSAKVK